MRTAKDAGPKIMVISNHSMNLLKGKGFTEGNKGSDLHWGNTATLPCQEYRFKKWKDMTTEFFYFIIFKNYFIGVQVLLSAFTPHHSPNPSHPHLPPLIPTPLNFVHVSFIVVPENHSPVPSIIPSHLPWLLSDCYSCQCLWFCFACLFVLLIRCHLEVRSSGICPSPPGLLKTTTEIIQRLSNQCRWQMTVPGTQFVTHREADREESWDIKKIFGVRLRMTWWSTSFEGWRRWSNNDYLFMAQATGRLQWHSQWGKSRKEKSNEIMLHKTPSTVPSTNRH